ncbi:universal stress protein [Tenacibaculum caenipelagi]|uniref:Nucleotide-binding universal stress UspA family protein n=1 Tax=Tenacibaculum caenipelagi TaxID=1325435 RepID=A0A4R6TH23_9FLAO|nr:universal stress protein [Tenacibaculum caenipelagi]TDQ28429.1 nucleotide-binding universal stress UspA family protein [Tenacibaculum caenipelagi]
MKQSNYKILVLSDMKSSTNSTLRSAVSIAKMTQGNITFFHVKKPTDVVKEESQLSAMRTINKEYNTISKKIQNFISPFTEEYGVSINYKFSFGNIKNEIDQYIKENTPDIIVLGKRKSTMFNITGDNLTDFILKRYTSTIFIAENNNSLEPYKPFTLGLLNSNKDSLNESFTKKILANTTEPLVSFNIAKNQGSANNIQNSLNEESVDYVFDQNNNTIKNLSSYLLKNKIHLLHINRRKDKNSLTKSDIKAVINNLKTSLLVTSI